MLDKFLRDLKNRGVTPRDNIRTNSIIKSFTYYNSTNKPGSRLLDLCNSKDTKVVIDKWNRLKIEDLCPVNMIVSALNWVVKVPPRASQYRTEAILGSIRTKKHICKFATNDGIKRPCHICGKEDSLEHVVFFCASPQITWTSMAIRYEQLTGGKIEINTHLCLLGKAKGNNCHKTLANRLASTTLWWICKTYYETKDLKVPVK